MCSLCYRLCVVTKLNFKKSVVVLMCDHQRDLPGLSVKYEEEGILTLQSWWIIITSELYWRGDNTSFHSSSIEWSLSLNARFLSLMKLERYILHSLTLCHPSLSPASTILLKMQTSQPTATQHTGCSTAFLQ